MSEGVNNIPLLPHAILMSLLRRTRRPAKNHVAKKLPKAHGNYYNQIKIYKETNIQFKILVDNMFQNYFLISYRRHNFFVLFLCIYFPNNDVSIFLTKPFQCIFNKAKGT